MIGNRTLLCAASAACGLALGINASAATLTLSVDACDSFSINNNVVTCNTSGGVGAPASCSLAPLNPSVAIGSSQTLTMNCSNMGGTVAYNWGQGCTSTSGNTCFVSAAAATAGSSLTIGVHAIAGTNDISKSSTLSFFDPDVGGGGGPIPATCTSDGSKTVKGPTINVFDSQPVFAALGNKQTAVFPVVMPAAGKIILRYFQQGDLADSTSRTAYIAKTPCDMGSHVSGRRTIQGAFDQQQFAFGTSTGNLSGVVDVLSKVTSDGAGTVLHGAPGQTWYLMIQNKDSAGGDTCRSATCGIWITPSASN